MVKVPKIVAYFIKHNENQKDAILILIQASYDSDAVDDAIADFNISNSIGITDAGCLEIMGWVSLATADDLLGLVNGWEVDTDGR